MDVHKFKDLNLFMDGPICRVCDLNVYSLTVFLGRKFLTKHSQLDNFPKKKHHFSIAGCVEK